MKKYEPRQMVASSRYRNYFPTLSAEIRQDVYSRMNELLMDEKEYQYFEEEKVIGFLKLM